MRAKRRRATSGHCHAMFIHLRSHLGTVFFGWWIVGGAAGVQFLLSVLLLQAYGAYAAIWREEFGWSATVLALAYALHRAETGLLGPAQGWLIERFGAQNVMRVGVVLLSVGFMLLSRIETLLAFYLTFALMALGGSLLGILSLMAVIVNWFRRKRATAMAVMQGGMSVGGLAVPVTAWALLTFGWRDVAMASGLITLVSGLFITQLMRSTPEELGLHPDGLDTNEAKGADRDGDLAAEPEYTARQALATSSFWLLSIAHAAAVTIVSAVLVHLVLHLHTGLGYSIQTAALVFALVTASSLVGLVLGGAVGDRFDKRTIAALAMIGHASALLALALGASAAWVVFFAVMHGLAWGVRGPLMGALRADYFGRKSFPTIMGLSSVIVMFGSMAGPVVAGSLADLLGDYRVSFSILAAVGFAGAASFLLASKPKARAP